MNETKNILPKLHKVMQSVERIEKDKRNDKQGYDYASEKIIKETLHKQFVENKIIFQLETSNPRIETSEFKSRDGDQMVTITFIDCKYTFHDIESGETVSGTFVGSGSARDDKGYYAAITGAIKYILTSTFLIPTGDDPEDNRNDEPKTRPRQETQPNEKARQTGICPIHNTPMYSGVTNGKRWIGHKTKDGKYCSGGGGK